MGEIKIVNPWDSRWIALVQTVPEANFFHHPAWIENIADCYGFRPFILAMTIHDKYIRAGLPIIEVKNLLRGRRWTSLPFTDHCVPLYSDADSLTGLAEGLTELSQGLGSTKIELRCEMPSLSQFRTASHQVMHTLPLCPDSEAVARCFHGTHRRNIKVAQKRGVRIERGDKLEHLGIFYRLHLQTRRRQGMPAQPWKFFAGLGSRLIEKGLGHVLLAYKGETCLAAALYFHWNRTLTYKYGASAGHGLSLRPNNLLFWESIRWGCENGYSLLDMGKTILSNTGLRKWKSGWGAEETPLYYSYSAPEPPRVRRGAIMPLMAAAIRHSPRFVHRAVGNLFYRYFA